MATAAEIEQRTAFESARRARLAVPAVAGGVLYLLSGIIVSSALKELPAVGIVQGLEPVLRGEPNPTVSPRAPEVSYIDHHAFGLIAGSVLTVIAVLALTLVLLFIVDSTRFRRPETWPPARPLVLAGGVGYALMNLVHQVLLVVGAHKFVTGKDLSGKAVDRALLTAGSVGVTMALVALVAALALAVGMIAVMVGSMRAGLLPRWLSVLGILSGLLFLPFFGTATLQLIPTFWLAATGILLMERWPSGDPPAWAVGEARPWPTQAEQRAKREEEKGGPGGRSRAEKDASGKDASGKHALGKNASGKNASGKDASTGNGSAADVGPAPTPAASGSRRKRRKRG